MLRSLLSKMRQTSWFNRSSSSSSREEHHHHQPAYTLYHNDTSDICMHLTPLESPSPSTLTYDQVTGRHAVAGHPLARRVLAAAILSSFLAGLALGLMTHNDVTLSSPSNERGHRSSVKQVRDRSFRFSHDLHR